ncbi:hypothetical protein [Acinetobacter baumannii]|uniref:hypothetical protein n=1 Tax=Acinetobacter baumannii TaxID=470 RepID=UPI00045189DC|nr:hypothetical protein [Acinetobacter baumannii]EXD17031.1 hypothetical protein J479_1270 [Acinetobacter baumannii 1297]TPU09100.1 hypothetical protein FJV00_12440 [Acinetobacter baumannii]
MKIIEIHEAFKISGGYDFTHISTNENPPREYWKGSGQYIASIFEDDKKKYFVYHPQNLSNDELIQLHADWLRKFLS